MSEKLEAELLKEKLFKSNKNGRLEASAETLEKADEYCEGYKAFLDAAKTEREAVKVSVSMAEKAGFKEFKLGEKYSVGDKVYINNRGKAVAFAVIGKEPVENGVYTLLYPETQESEDGAAVTQDIKLTMTPSRVTMTREGAFSTTMIFVRGQRFEGAYHTPYGDLEMAVFATKVDCRLAPHAGSVNLQYTLDMQGAFAAMNTLELTYAVNARKPS